MVFMTWHVDYKYTESDQKVWRLSKHSNTGTLERKYANKDKFNLKEFSRKFKNSKEEMLLIDHTR